jgi:hypothetical protein
VHFYCCSVPQHGQFTTRISTNVRSESSNDTASDLPKTLYSANERTTTTHLIWLLKSKMSIKSSISLFPQLWIQCACIKKMSDLLVNNSKYSLFAENHSKLPDGGNRVVAIRINTEKPIVIICVYLPTRSHKITKKTIILWCLMSLLKSLLNIEIHQIFWSFGIHPCY